jgi:hypothetical protein
MTKIIQLLAFSTLIIFASCKGKDGIPGPVGPSGPSGATGVQGIPGQMGLTGATGNANVKAKVFSASITAWSPISNTTNGVFYESYATIPEITQAIHDKGLVLGFVSEGSDQSVWQGMPYLQVYKLGSSTFTQTYRFSERVGQVTVTRQDSDGLTLVSTTAKFFKFVVIEGTGALPPDVDPTNYKQVAKYLNLDAL